MTCGSVRTGSSHVDQSRILWRLSCEGGQLTTSKQEPHVVSKTITRVSHRHCDQKRSDPDLVIEVGRTLPEIYERPGREVRSIEGKDPIRCTLDDGDIVNIGRRNNRDITRA